MMETSIQLHGRKEDPMQYPPGSGWCSLNEIEQLNCIHLQKSYSVLSAAASIAKH